MNDLTPELRELLRRAILNQLDANDTRFGLRASVMQITLTALGHHASQVQVERELEYLVEKGLVNHTTKLISPENESWKITATGRDFLASNQQ